MHAVRPRTGPTHGAIGPVRPSIVIPPAPARATRGNRGGSRAKGNRGGSRARGRIFYPPTSRFVPPSSAPLQSGIGNIAGGYDLSHSQRSLNQ